MKQPSTPRKARCVDRQVVVEHEGHLDPDFGHHGDSSATEAPGAYLLECAEGILRLSRSEGDSLVDELLLIS